MPSVKGMREIQEGVFAHPDATIDVHDLQIGRGSVIHARARIFGHKVRIGREAWIDEGAIIGGGSAYDPIAYLEIGDWLHMGVGSQLNIARGIRGGHEVGIGIGTRVFTHGSYLAEIDGFPVVFEGVQLGSSVWLPSAQVNPGVTIGSNVVVAAGSVINNDLPDGCLAAGSPARVKKEQCYPRAYTLEQLTTWTETFRDECIRLGIDGVRMTDPGIFAVDDVTFDTRRRQIFGGKPTKDSEGIKNQLRRRGIRFRYWADPDGYVPW